MSAIRPGTPAPSPNTAPEPATCAPPAGMPGATTHFRRLGALSIALEDGPAGRFDPAPMVAAAEMPADAKMHAICWDGTSGAWLGLAADRALCGAITAETGIPALDSVAVALWGALRAAGEAPALPG